MTDVVVVGGGIAGLAAAWELARRGDGTRVTVLEADGRPGGKISTTDVDGQPIDAGADAFLARVPEAVDLCRELGLEHELVAPGGAGAYVATPSGLRRLPDGLVLGVPARLGPMLRAGLLSPRGLLRAGIEPLLPGRPLADGDDVALGRLVRRRFGHEVHERLVDPLVGSINAGDTDHLGLVAAVPQLAAVAQRSRSLLLGLRAAAHDRSAAPPVGPVFLTHPRGLGHVVAVLVARLRAAGAEVLTGAAADALTPIADGRWAVGSGDRRWEGDGVVLATPAGAAARLLADHAPAAADLLAGIEYASVVMVTLVVDASDVGRPLDGTGLLVPRTLGDGLVTAVSWGSTKWPHWGTPGHQVLRVSMGHADDDRALALDDERLVAAASTELLALMDLRGTPVAARVTRWPASFPQYRPGHLDRVAAIERALARDAPGLAVAGAAYRGLGIPACIRQGRRAAAALVGPAAG